MTTGTWDRHRGHSTGYDVIGLGFNYRIDEPRAALLLSRLPRLETDIAAGASWSTATASCSPTIDGISMPFDDDERRQLLLLRDADDARRRRRRGEPLRARMRERGIQTSVLYPAIHQFTAYASADMPRCRRASRSLAAELTLPLFPTLTEARPGPGRRRAAGRAGDRPRHQRDCRGGRGRPWRRLT